MEDADESSRKKGKGNQILEFSDYGQKRPLFAIMLPLKIPHSEGVAIVNYDSLNSIEKQISQQLERKKSIVMIKKISVEQARLNLT